MESNQWMMLLQIALVLTVCQATEVFGRSSGIKIK